MRVYSGFLLFLITINRPYYGKVNVRSAYVHIKYVQHNKKKVLVTLLTLRGVLSITVHYLYTVTYNA